MNIEKIDKNSIDRIKNLELIFDNNYISNLLNEDYQEFFDNNDIEKNFNFIFKSDDYASIIQNYKDGYNYEQMLDLDISQKKLDTFLTLIKENNLSLSQVIAFNRYSEDSKMILGYLRGKSTKELWEDVTLYIDQRLDETSLNNQEKNFIKDYVIQLDYNKPLYYNYEKVKKHCTIKNYKKSDIYTINSIVNKIQNFYNLPSTIKDLKQGLSNTNNQPMILYRAVKSDFLKKKFDIDITKPNDCIGKKIIDNGFTSTSILYKSSFAKYKDYDVVFKIYAPKNTNLTCITPFSVYGDEEFEVLCDSNDLIIYEATPNFIDEFGHKKTLFKTLMISKNKEKENIIDKTDNFERQNF